MAVTLHTGPDSDTHLCLNCNTTVVGLERYTEHCRSQHDNHLCLMCQETFCSLDNYLQHRQYYNHAFSDDWHQIKMDKTCLLSPNKEGNIIIQILEKSLLALKIKLCAPECAESSVVTGEQQNADKPEVESNGAASATVIKTELASGGDDTDTTDYMDWSSIGAQATPPTDATSQLDIQPTTSPLNHKPPHKAASKPCRKKSIQLDHSSNLNKSKKVPKKKKQPKKVQSVKIQPKVGEYKCSKCTRSFEAKSQKDMHELGHQLMFNESDALDKDPFFGIDAKYHDFVKTLPTLNAREKVPCPESECDKVLRRVDMYPHLRSHTNSKPFECTDCTSKFGDPKSLRRHYKYVHLNLKNKICQYCGHAFGTNSKLDEHVKLKHVTMTEESSFMCDTCGKVFITKSQLWSHARTQHRKKITCSVEGCGFTAPFESSLKEHMRVHSNDGPLHICPICGFTTRAKNYLKKHILIHTGEKKLKCEQCDYKTTTGNKLRRHMRTHTGEKPYKCQYCAYACSTPGNINMHMKSRHKDLAIYCCKYEACHFGTNSVPGFRDHMVMVHGEVDFKQSYIKEYLNIYQPGNDTVSSTYGITERYPAVTMV